MKRPYSSSAHLVFKATLFAACGALTLPSVASASQYLPDPTYIEPLPVETASCNFLDPSALPVVTIASGDVNSLYSNAAAGGRVIRLMPGGYWPLTETLYVAPDTMILGDPNQLPMLEAIEPMESVVQLTTRNRIESVWIAGQIANGQHGVLAQPWTDCNRVAHPPTDIQISGSFIEEVAVSAFTATDGSCFQVYNTLMSNAGNCYGEIPGGGLMDLRSIQLMDVDTVTMHYANVFGLRGREVVGFFGNNIAVNAIADQNAIWNACEDPHPDHRGSGIELVNQQSSGPVDVHLEATSMTEITGTGLVSTGVGLRASIDYIGLSLFAQQNGDAENAVISSSDARVCIGLDQSTAPFSLLTCGQVTVPCLDSIDPKNICP